MKETNRNEIDQRNRSAKDGDDHDDDAGIHATTAMKETNRNENETKTKTKNVIENEIGFVSFHFVSFRFR